MDWGVGRAIPEGSCSVIYWSHDSWLCLILCSYILGNNWMDLASLWGEGNGIPLQYSWLEIPWMEKPDRLQSIGSQRVGHDWVTSLSFSLSCIGEGNGNPLRCSCLKNPRDGGAWWAAVYGVAHNRTWQKWLSSSSSSSLVMRGNCQVTGSRATLLAGVSTLLFPFIISVLFNDPYIESLPLFPEAELLLRVLICLIHILPDSFLQ